MDPLSDVLSLLRLRSYWCSGFDFGGDWSVELGPSDDIKFYAAISGECFVAIDGISTPLRVAAGDCFVLPRGRAFRVASDLALKPVNPLVVFPDNKRGGIAMLNGGGDFFCVGGQFSLSGEFAGELIGSLPPVVHIQDQHDKSELRWCVERMRHELREPQPGGFLVAQQLATLILIAALRMHLAEAGGVGWLFALSDRQLAIAINAIHADPSGRWTVAALADRCGMSRTAFTLRFRDVVGLSPIEYLTRWRMMLAGDALTSSRKTISEIAVSLGYESESAFSTAFKRVMGTSPRRYASARAEPLASVAV